VCRFDSALAVDPREFRRDSRQVGITKYSGMTGPTDGPYLSRSNHVLDPMQFPAESPRDFPHG
jgi:hypothetical protein